MKRTSAVPAVILSAIALAFAASVHAHPADGTGMQHGAMGGTGQMSGMTMHGGGHGPQGAGGQHGAMGMGQGQARHGAMAQGGGCPMMSAQQAPATPAPQQ